MKVKFLRDFQGKATREVFYKQGQEVELEHGAASAVVAEGVAEYVRQAPATIEYDYHDNTPQFENAAEPPRPKVRKRK